MRIITGIHRGRRLAPPKDDAIRPTTDRSRESLFNLLLHGKFDESPVIGQSVLDLCCGTGALGLEALSRGAAHVTFVDSARQAIALTKQNIATLNEASRSKVITADVAKLPRANAPVALVMMDAPYHTPLILPAYKSLQAGGWLREGTVLALEMSIKDATPELKGCTALTERVYGKSKIVLLMVE